MDKTVTDPRYLPDPDYQPEQTRLTPFWNWLADWLIFFVSLFEKIFPSLPHVDP